MTVLYTCMVAGGFAAVAAGLSLRLPARSRGIRRQVWLRNAFRSVLSALLMLGAFGFQVACCCASDFYVDQGNAGASDSNPGTLAQPWRTITKANQTLTPGQRVLIRQGGYTSYIAPAHSGLPGSPITYAAYERESVTISNAAYAVYLVGNSNIVVQGINATNVDAFVYFSGASSNTLANCTFFQQRGTSMYTGASIKHSSRYNWIHHCVFGNSGFGDPNNSFGSVFWIGDDLSTTDHSDYNLVEDNTMFHGGHDVMTVSGSYNVVRRNYFHNENWYPADAPAYGQRCLMLMGDNAVSSHNLIEGNRIGFSGYYYYGSTNYSGSSGMGLVSRSNIVRFNCFYANSVCGLRLAVTAAYPTSPCYNTVYNNSFFTNGLSPLSGYKNGLTVAWWSGTNYVIGNTIKNNLFYKNPGDGSPIVFDGANAADQIIAANWTSSTDPQFADISSILSVTNSSLPDLRLKASSPCIDQGAYLTQIISPSGSGKTFQVGDATGFTDGWGIIAGDQIQLQGSAQRARIVSVDYGTRTLTCDVQLTWSQGQGISLPYEGAGPDIGAFEFGPTQIKPGPPGNLRVVQ